MEKRRKEGGRDRRKRRKKGKGYGLSGAFTVPHSFSLHWPKAVRVSRWDGRGELTVSHLTQRTTVQWSEHRVETHKPVVHL